jgi:hypothetical protein
LAKGRKGRLIATILSRAASCGNAVKKFAAQHRNVTR